MQSRTLRRVVVAVVAVLLVVAAVYAARSSASIAAGKESSPAELTVPGLTQPVEVYRNAVGTPTIIAQNNDDLFAAYGYVTAEDRLFQIDYMRRASGGRLAEIRGPEFVANDRYFRTIGLTQHAEAVVAASDPDTRRLLEQFSKGVNAYMDAHRNNLPVEFKRLAYTPEPWTPVDSMLVWKTLGFALDVRRWQGEVSRAQIVAKLGKEAEELFPSTDLSATILQPGEMSVGGASTSARAVTMPDLGLLGNDAFEGSNNWVVSGKKSVTGKPILASDPHLRITAPAVWNEAHLKGGDFDVAGIGLPGAPFMLIGNNADIAWAVTYSTVDITDVYEEKINPANPREYEYMGKWVPVHVRQETIRVKGGAPVTLEVRSTRHGPIVTEFAKPDGKNYALRWSDYELKRNELQALRLANTAKNWQQFTAGLRLYNSMTSNFIYADKAGNIGYQVAGVIPIRKKGKGTVPVPGWTDEYEWSGWVPFEENPHVYNPERGWVATANNKIAGPWYPYYLSDPGNLRAERIHEVLQGQEKFSVEDFKKLQADTRSTQPRPIVPVILKAFEGRNASPEVRSALKRLEEWTDHSFDRNGIAPTIYDAFYTHLTENTLLDEAGGDRENFGVFGRANLNRLILERPDARWFDNVTTPARETLQDIVAKSLEDAVATLTTKFSADQDEWRWERQNQIDIPHMVPLGAQVDPLFPEFRLGPFPKEGRGGWTVNPVSTNSYKMIIDFSDLDRSISVLPPGASGDPASKHFKDQAAMWVDGTYNPKPHSREKIVSNATRRTVLKPKG